MLLNAKEKDLAIWEGALAATLCGKDKDIEALLKQWTQELEDGHKKSIEAQSLESAAKLKEAADKATATASAKAELESQMARLKEDLAGNVKEIEALKDEALKAARTLGDLQMQLSSKNQDLHAAGKTIRDLKSRSQITVMDMKSWGFTINDKESTSIRLNKFFKGLINTLKTYHKDRSTSFTDES
jgi:chromosome segregation ATPase